MGERARRRAEAQKLIELIRDNIRKLHACPRHRFKTDVKIEFGGKVACLECGGTMDMLDASEYTRGFIAAGGDPELVYPGWTAPTIED